MKKILVCLSLLTLVAGFAFAKTCSRCGTEYYGSACPYCRGYGNGIKDEFNGTNSTKSCEHNGSYYGLDDEKKTKDRASCYEGYEDARNGKGSKTPNE